MLTEGNDVYVSFSDEVVVVVFCWAFSSSSERRLYFPVSGVSTYIVRT